MEKPNKYALMAVDYPETKIHAPINLENILCTKAPVIRVNTQTTSFNLTRSLHASK